MSQVVEMSETTKEIHEVKPLPSPSARTYNIEDTPVHDDPRKWSKSRKNLTLATVSCASLLLTIAIGIYNPALNDVVQDLHSDFQTVSWTLSTNALVTGVVPLVWGTFTEFYGRKILYLLSISFFILGSGVAGSAKSIGVLIAMRVIQGIGASAVLTIGAATLADMYPPKERGRVMGLYYAAPLLGPSLGPLIGGIITNAFSWRATFYFLAIFGGVSLISFVFFKDTFRKERSLAYQAALKNAELEAQSAAAIASVDSAPNRDSCARHVGEKEVITPVSNSISHSPERIPSDDLESQSSRGTTGQSRGPNVRLRHMQTLQPMLLVVRRPNNICVLSASGIMFGGISYCLPFTAVRTFGQPPYNYNSLKIGSVLLSFGIGSVLGSLLGGRWSDRTRQRLQAKNDGVSKSEHRLHSATPLMPIFIGSLLAYAWMADKKVHIAGICVVLFLVGFSSIWIYTSQLAYIVDANTGRSSSAVSVNSFFRGTTAFAAAEIAIPLQDSLGDGGLFTLMAGAMLFICGLVLVVAYRGTAWRERAEQREYHRNRGEGPTGS